MRLAMWCCGSRVALLIGAFGTAELELELELKRQVRESYDAAGRKFGQAQSRRGNSHALQKQLRIRADRA